MVLLLACSMAKADQEVIPLVDLKANYASIKSEIDVGIQAVLDSAYFIGAPVCAEFEVEFAKWVGTKYAIGLNSGTDALILGMKYLGIGCGDEVITQGNTFIATCLGASNNGADIVLVDHDPDTYMIDVSQIESKITPRTKAIAPVHLYGHCAPMDEILDIARKHGLLVIEDAAQAHGAFYKGRRAGSMGDIGCFSFYPGKNLGAFGDGGALVTNLDAVNEKVRSWRSWGAVKKYYHEEKGGNSRLDSIQAAVLLAKLRHMDNWNALRRQHAAEYSSSLAKLAGELKIDIKLPQISPNCEPVWHLYVIQVSERDALLKYLNENKIGAGIHYPIPIAELGAYQELLPQAGGLPICTSAKDRLLSLPMYPELTSLQIQRVVSTIKEFYLKWIS